MEGQSSQQITSGNFDGNAYYVSKDDQNQLTAIFTELIENQLESGLLLSQWVPRSYVELLNDDSIYLENAPVADVMQDINSPVGDQSAAIEVYGMQKETADSSVGSRGAFGLKPNNSALYSAAWNLKPSVHVQSRNNPEASGSEIIVKRQVEEEYRDKLMHPRLKTSAKTQPQTGDRQDSSEFSSKNRVTASKRGNMSRRKANASERERNLRIADDIKALQELLPNPVEDTPESILNDVIAHVKLLQLQIKELSRSRLGGEPTSHPFISIEGYGHYIHHEQVTKEPLEEMMAKLLETDASAAITLLESKGLYLMPMALVEKFCQAP